MTNTIVQTRFLLRRFQDSTVPEELHFGEPAYVHGEKALYIGGPNKEVVNVSGGSGGSVIHVGPTPPTDASKLLWIQTGSDGALIERWQRRPNDIWVSDRQWAVTDFKSSVTANRSVSLANPCPSARLWIEDFVARGRSKEPSDVDNGWTFRLGVINANLQEVPLWQMELPHGAKNAVFRLFEPVGLLIAEHDSVALRLRRMKKGTASLAYTSISATIRRVYDAPDNSTA